MSLRGRGRRNGPSIVSMILLAGILAIQPDARAQGGGVRSITTQVLNPACAELAGTNRDGGNVIRDGEDLLDRESLPEDERGDLRLRDPRSTQQNQFVEDGSAEEQAVQNGCGIRARALDSNSRPVSGVSLRLERAVNGTNQFQRFESAQTTDARGFAVWRFTPDENTFWIYRVTGGGATSALIPLPLCGQTDGGFDAPAGPGCDVALRDNDDNDNGDVREDLEDLADENRSITF